MTHAEDHKRGRLQPLPADRNPELKPAFDKSITSLGFIPNSMLILQYRPEIMVAFSQLTGSLWGPSSTVDNGLKRLIAFVASRSAGCQYCMAHTAGGALYFGISEEKLEAVWSFETSSLYNEAERAALTLAIAAAAVPNCATDEMFDDMRGHWSEEQIVEIVATVAVFGFLNRWNDTMSTPLEEKPMEVGSTLLAKHRWTPGKHVTK